MAVYPFACGYYPCAEMQGACAPRLRDGDEGFATITGWIRADACGCPRAECFVVVYNEENEAPGKGFVFLG